MKKYVPALLVFIIVIVVFLFTREGTCQAEAIKAPVNPPQKQDLRSEKFEPARKMLREAGVPFDPDVLLSDNWRDQLGPTLNAMAEMQSTFRSANKLSGVQIADTLVLPEKVELTGDLVILANSIVLEGLKTEITGVGKNVYIFPVNETVHLGKTFSEALKQKGKTGCHLTCKALEHRDGSHGPRPAPTTHGSLSTVTVTI